MSRRAMASMDRRSWFAAAGGAAGFGMMPAWLGFFARAGQDPKPAPPPTRRQQLQAAAEQAEAQGRPLLVFVVPEDENAAYTRGQWLGAWWMHGGERARLDLALCVPAAASVRDVQALVDVRLPDPAPVLLLVDAPRRTQPGRQAATVTPIVVDLPADASPGLPADLERLTLALATALPRHGGALDEMAQRVRARLSDEQQQHVAGWLAGGPPPEDELLVRATAWVRCAAAGMEAEPSRSTQAALLAAIERRLVRRRLPGSRWATSSGCGAEIEDPDPALGEVGAGVECGMGRVPEVCRRFLLFYTGA